MESDFKEKQLDKVMVKESLVPVSVQCCEHVDVLIAGHMMMMTVGNDTRKGDMIMQRRGNIGLSNEYEED